MKTRKRILLILFLATALLCAACLGAVFAQTGGTAELKGVSLRDSYFLGETLSVEGASIVSNGKEERAEAVLYMPGGKAVRGTSFTFGTEGAHLIRFRTETGISVDKNFEVGKEICTFSENGGSYEITERGLEISLNEQNSVTVNKVIDISQAEADDAIVSLEIVPAVPHKADFKKITVTLTDAENPDLYIRLLLQSSEQNPGGSYGQAGGTDQILTGYEKEWDRIHKNNQYGAYMPFTFYGEAGAYSTFGFYYDKQTKEISALPGYPIIDLDESRFFPNKWKGFESDKVILSVTCSSYVADEAHFTVRGLMGEKIEDALIRDSFPPQVEIEYPEDTEYPYAEVGKQYPLFGASVKDDSGQVTQFYTYVYYNYGKLNRINVDCADGYFIPEKEGIYTIVYEAYDAYGNCGRKRIDVTAVDFVGEPQISFVQETPSSAQAGQELILPECEVTYANGATEISRQAVRGEEIFLIEGDSFVPQEEGEYTIEYIAKDHLGKTAKLAFDLIVERADVPYFAEEPVLPRYFICGNSYPLYAIRMLDYISGKCVEKVSEISVVQDGVRTSVEDGESVLFDKAGTAEIVYSLGGVEKKVRIPVIDVKEGGALDMGKYFDAEGGSVSVSSKGTSIEGGEGTAVTFINPLLAEGLTMNLSIGTQGMQEFAILLTDSENKEETLLVTLKKNGDSSVLYIGEKKVADCKDIGFTEFSASNEVSFLLQGGEVSVDGIAMFDIEDGTGTFSSGLVYVRFIFVRTEGSASLLVKNLNRQPTNQVAADRIKPKISLYHDYGGERNVGDTVYLGKAGAADVLSPHVTFTVSVMTPDGTGYVTADDGTLLKNADGSCEYKFTVTEYGNYKVVYEASDGTQTGKLQYAVLVEDKQAPEIETSFEVRGEYKAGSKIALPKISVKDNETSEEELSPVLYLTAPSGMNFYIDEGTDSIVLTAAGNYVLHILVSDGAGNMAMLNMRFSVV